MTFVMASHPESWVEEEDMSRIIPPYRKTFGFQGQYIDPFHESIAALPDSQLYAGPIKGSLRTADALKLYEMAHFSTGDILELGSYHGLSSWIMSNALRNAKASYCITSIDISAEFSQIAENNIGRYGLDEFCFFRAAEAAEGIRQLAKEDRAFSFAFIDHSHSMEDVLSACVELPRVMASGSPVAFHDLNDYRNADSAFPEYGVIEGVRKAQDQVTLEFRGVYGCLGLYQLYF